MRLNSVMIKRRIWDTIMMFVITNGFGGAILLFEDLRTWGLRFAMSSKSAAVAGECAA